MLLFLVIEGGGLGTNVASGLFSIGSLGGFVSVSGYGGTETLTGLVNLREPGMFYLTLTFGFKFIVFKLRLSLGCGRLSCRYPLSFLSFCSYSFRFGRLSFTGATFSVGVGFYCVYS